jgi:hypothetical protein
MNRPIPPRTALELYTAAAAPLLAVWRKSFGHQPSEPQRQALIELLAAIMTALASATSPTGGGAQ